MENQVHGPIVTTILAMLAVAGGILALLRVDAELARILHWPLFLVSGITVLAVGFALAGVWLAGRTCLARWPDFWRWGSRTAAQEPGLLQDPLPEFCSGAPVATIDPTALFMVARPRRRGAGYDTFVARFDRSANAWRDQSSQIKRRFHHGDRWLFLDEHWDTIERASKRMRDAFNPLDAVSEIS